MKKTIKILAILGMLTPVASFAQGTGVNFSKLTEFVAGLSTAVGLLIPIAFAAILLFFFWGLAKYMFGDAEEKDKGKNLMIWGVIALFVAASIWGLVAFLQQVFGVDTTESVNNPVVIPRSGIQ